MKAIQHLECLALIAALWLACATAHAKDLGTFPVDGAPFEFAVSTPSLELNKLTSLTVKIQPKDPMQPTGITGISFDARMPAHNHGMVVKPRVSEIGPGEYRVDGVKLHMAGDWEMTFVFKQGAGELKKIVPYKL